MSQLIEKALPVTAVSATGTTLVEPHMPQALEIVVFIGLTGTEWIQIIGAAYLVVKLPGAIKESGGIMKEFIVNTYRKVKGAIISFYCKAKNSITNFYREVFD